MSQGELYGRRASVLIGPNEKEGKLIRDLRITFKIEKNLEKHPNPAIIQIYNASEHSRSLMEQTQSKILIQAGYQSPEEDPKKLPTLFKGSIAKVTTKKQGADIITEIEAADGGGVFGVAQINKSYSPGTQIKQVIQDAIKAMGLSSGQIAGLDTVIGEYTHGISLSGMATNAITQVLNRAGLEWSIQDETLQILPPDTATNDKAIRLTSDTGLIGSPYKTKVIDSSIAKPKNGMVARTGIKFVALLNADLRPGRRIQVDSDQIDEQVFRIYRVVFDGDTHGKHWYAEIEAL